MRTAAAWTLLALVGVLCARTARGQDDGLRRLVAEMDFEGFLEIGQALPKGWYATELPGGLFPHYVTAKVVEDDAHGGRASFLQALDGGNIAWTYTDSLSVYPGNDYLLTGWVRTEKLSLARAQARIFFLDAAGRPIRGAEAVGEPLGGPGSPCQGQWQPFTVKLRNEFPQAARVRITLSVVQPRIWQGAACRDIYQEDIEGLAWWDDLAIYRLPLIDVRTDVPANVFPPGVPPRLHITMDGVDYADCGAALTVRDATAEVVLRRIIEVDPSRPRNDVTIPLPELPPGLYDAELAISASGRVLTHEYCRFARLPEVPLARTDLGIDATDMPRAQWTDLLAIARAMQVGTIKLPVWPAEAELGLDASADASAASQPTSAAARTAEGIEANRQLQHMLAAMQRLGIRAVLALTNLPPELLDPSRPRTTLLDAIAARDPLLEQALSQAVAWHGQHVDAWQIGRTDDYEMTWSSRLPAAHEAAREWMSRLITRPPVVMRWDGMFAFDAPFACDLALVLPSAAVPEYLGAQLANFGDRVHHVHLELQPDSVARLERLADFALRYAYVRAAGVDRIFLDPPWRTGPKGVTEPTEALLVARTLAAYLGEADYIGTARLDVSAVALVFRRPQGDAVMLVHNRPTGDESPEVAIDLPPAAEAVDLWGRRSALPRRADGHALLRPGALPILIAGGDAAKLALRTSLQLTPLSLPSTYQQHQVTLSFVNPYDEPVNGLVRILAPEGWTITPRMVRFSLAPRERFEHSLAVAFPYNASAGLEQFDVAVDIDARQAWSVTAPTFFYLALEGVAFDVVQSVGADGALEVQAVVTNRTDQPLSVYAFVDVPDEPRQTRVVQELPPGATAVKLFRFPNVARLRGQSLRAGLRDLTGPALLNYSAVIR